MPFRIDDRWLWIGLGAFTILAVRGVSYALKDILHLTEIHEQPRSKHFCTVSQDTEDAIKPESLKVLLQSHNLDIRNAGVRIICDRFLSSPANITALTRDMYAANPDRRQQAINALKLLERYASPDAFFAVSFLDQLRRDTEVREEISGLLGDEGALAEIAHFESLRRAGLLERPEPSQLPRLREREESFEEQALRRRRREAVVINEGDRPLRQQDIIQRNAPGIAAVPRDELERLRVERALEEISHAGNPGLEMLWDQRRESIATWVSDEEQPRDGV